MNCEHSRSHLSLQPQRHHSALAKPQTLCRMSEGDVIVLPTASLDFTRQEHRKRIRLYSQNGGFHLRILPDGTVSGGMQDNDPHGEEIIIFFLWVLCVIAAHLNPQQDLR